MSKYSAASASQIPNIIPPQAAESKRDRKRRETVNKIEMLHNGSWNNRDECVQNGIQLCGTSVGFPLPRRTDQVNFMWFPVCCFVSEVW